VVVLQEEHRRRAEVGAVDGKDLWRRRALEHRLIARAKYSRRAFEAFPAFGVKTVGTRPRRVQVPVDMIAAGNRRVGCERQAAAQQALAHRGRQISDGQAVALRSAGTGEEQQAKPVWPRICGGKRRKLPWFAERGTAGIGQGQGVARRRLEICRVELPATSSGVVHPAGHCEPAGA